MGEPYAQAYSGIIIENGYAADHSTDVEAARTWYEKSATQVNSVGQRWLGNLYCAGLGVQEDYKTAAFWLNKAAGQDDVKAKLSLGMFYLEDSGFRDYEKAAQWLENASSQGHVQAQAKFSYKRAALNGCALSSKRLGVLYEKDSDNKSAREWYTRAAEGGNARAQTQLSLILIEHGDVDAVKAWLIKAAQIDLAYQYHLETNNEQAEFWYLQAAEHKSSLAQCNLGLLY
eukprot:scaffold4457_cov169-Amphora_coffeaeformis.AAC.8